MMALRSRPAGSDCLFRPLAPLKTGVSALLQDGEHHIQPRSSEILAWLLHVRSLLSGPWPPAAPKLLGPVWVEPSPPSVSVSPAQPKLLEAGDTHHFTLHPHP